MSTIKQKVVLESADLLRNIVDVYLCKHGIPYTRESSGSGVVYHCPFSANCNFRITSTICRSKSPGKRGIYNMFLIIQRKSLHSRCSDEPFMSVGSCKCSISKDTNLFHRHPLKSEEQYIDRVISGDVHHLPLSLLFRFANREYECTPILYSRRGKHSKTFTILFQSIDC